MRTRIAVLAILPGLAASCVLNGGPRTSSAPAQTGAVNVATSQTAAEGTNQTGIVNVDKLQAQLETALVRVDKLEAVGVQLGGRNDNLTTWLLAGGMGVAIVCAVIVLGHRRNRRRIDEIENRIRSVA